MFHRKSIKLATLAALGLLITGTLCPQTTTTTVAAARGLAGKWDTTLMFKGHEIKSIFTFDVDDKTTPGPEPHVRFTGSLRDPKMTPDQGVHFTDGEIIGNQFSFTTWEKKGGEWREDQIVSIYTGSFEGDTIKMVYLNTEPRDPANPNKVKHTGNYNPPPGGWLNMHLVTGHRIK